MAVMYDDWHGGWGWGAWLAMGFMMLAFWGVIVAAVVVFLRSPSRRGDTSSPSTAETPDQALRILDERFARGDIDADEYSQRREILRAR